MLSYNDFMQLLIHSQKVRAVLNDSLCHCVSGVTKGNQSPSKKPPDKALLPLAAPLTGFPVLQLSVT